MFTFPATEAWLAAMARQGWLLSEVRLRYCFIFRKAKPCTMAYRFDYAGYIVDGYLAQLSGQGWLIYRADRRWNICAHPVKDVPPQLATRYDGQVERHLAKTTPLIMILSVAMVVFAWYVVRANDAGLLITAVAIVATIVAVYDVLRLSFYRTMLQQRIAETSKK